MDILFYLNLYNCIKYRNKMLVLLVFVLRIAGHDRLQILVNFLTGFYVARCIDIAKVFKDSKEIRTHECKRETRPNKKLYCLRLLHNVASVRATLPLATMRSHADARTMKKASSQNILECFPSIS